MFCIICGLLDEVKNMSRINLYRMQFDAVLGMLKDYQIELESQLTRMQKDEADRIHTILKSIEDEDERYVNETIIGDEYHFTYEVMFPRSQRYSFVVLLFLNLENLLTRFSDGIKRRDGHQIRANDLKGDIIARSRMYLHKIANVPALPQDAWENIEDLSKVRNCIVHTLGEVSLSSDQKRILDIATQGIGLSIGDSDINEGFIVLEPIYCEKVVKDVSLLINELFDKAGYLPGLTMSPSTEPQTVHNTQIHDADK